MTLLVSLAFAAFAAAAPAGRLVYVQGPVKIESRKAVVPAKAGQPVSEGDAVSTGESAAAVIELPDGSRLKLRPSSRLVVRASRPRLTLGGVFARILHRSHRSFRLQAGPMVAAVRGTQFFAALQPQTNDAWLCVNDGAVEVRSGRRTVLVPKGLGVQVKAVQGPGQPKAYEWTKGLNWSMDPSEGSLEEQPRKPKASDDPFDW